MNEPMPAAHGRTDVLAAPVMRELKQFRPEDVAELSSVFDSLCGEGVTITAGPLSAIEKNKDRFESVLTDLIC